MRAHVTREFFALDTRLGPQSNDQRRSCRSVQLGLGNAMTSARSRGMKLLVAALGFATAATALAQTPSGPVKGIVKDGKVVTEEAAIPVDPTQRIAIGPSPGMFNFALSVDGNSLS